VCTGSIPTSSDCSQLQSIMPLNAKVWVDGATKQSKCGNAGGSPGQKINRLDFDGRGTMDFVIHRHAEIALFFSLAAVALWWLARRRDAAPVVQRSLTVLCVLLALQGVVGLDQYYTHLPTELVWVHVGLACGAWLAAIWAACAAAARVSRRVPGARARVAKLSPSGSGAPLSAAER